MRYSYLLILLSAGISRALPPVDVLVKKEDFSVSAPAGWTRNDQWFRELPRLDFFGSEGESGPRLSLERYQRENPLKLTPAQFRAALVESSQPAEKTSRKAGGRSFEAYVTGRMSPAARAPDFVEAVEWLGPGSPGVRSKIERCKKWGLYQLGGAYAKTRLSSKDFESFKKLFLKSKRTRRQIEICLGSPALAAMRRGEAFDFVPEPDEEEIIRLENLERGGEGRAEVQAVTVIEAENRFYVLRYTAPASAYAAGLPAFDRFLSSFKPN